MAKKAFDTDEDITIAATLLGWSATHAENTAVSLDIRLQPHSAASEAPKPVMLTLRLTPIQALDLAEEFLRQARWLMIHPPTAPLN